MAYEHSKIEKEAREKWAMLDLYSADLSDETKERYYLLTEFPYPSGDLHIGHWYAFAVTDIYARLLRARGKNVLFPIGFDAFGLPAENAAIKNGIDPREWTYANMERMREQLRSMGASFDWKKEIITCEPEYYQWTQWLFTKVFEHGLAEHRLAAVKWCPVDQTVLANEQVIDGHCERCGSPVEEKQLTQWFLKITDYAKRLVAGLGTLPWREEIKEAQRAWIGESEGAYLYFPIAGRDEKIQVFTTRPDTVFGATYVVLAPEHQLVSTLLPSVSNRKHVDEYIRATKQKTERERSENKEKTGVKLEGVMAVNPATKEEVPIYIADYVLASYGTGAVMAVPAHDERDFEFATRMQLPIRQVVAPKFIHGTGPGVFRPDEPVVETSGIIALVKHWAEEKYIGLTWKKVHWQTLLTGSIDKGLTPEKTVLKEIREETGFIHPKIIKKLGVVDGLFYHESKKRNQLTHGHMFVVELEDGAQKKITAKELATHEVRWLTLDELPSFLDAKTHQYTVELFRHGYQPYTGEGSLVDSSEFTGKNSEEVKWDIVKYVGGERTTQYRLRDWLVSRQRYWGCPIPIVYDPLGKPHAVPAEHLPWLLPADVDFKPTGAAPLASSKELKERVTRLFGEGWTPEYDTLDTFVDSSWYFLRYLAPHNSHNFSDVALMKTWLPINRYSGGSEHTTMHLLYARFFMKVLYDLALVPVDEPFVERFNRGLIMGPDGQKMSKSKGNVVNPDDFVQKYGADAVRIYLAFIGPYNEPGSYPWNLDGVASMRKFLERAVRIVDWTVDFEKKNKNTISEEREELGSSLSKTVGYTASKIEKDADRFKFNTAIAQLMILLNEMEAKSLTEMRTVTKWTRHFVIMLAPFAPHLAEHLWEKLEGEGSVHQALWPLYDERLLQQETIEVVIQVAGRKRSSTHLSREASEAEALAEAMKLPAVVSALGGKKPKRVVYVAGKILNLVV